MGFFSKIFSSKKDKEQKVEVEKIVSKFSSIPNYDLLRANALIAIVNEKNAVSLNKEQLEEEIEKYIEKQINIKTIEKVSKCNGVVNRSVAGINMRGDLSDYVCDGWREFIECELIEEPDNEFDRKAIKICIKQDGRHIGYVAKDDNQEARDLCNKKFPHTTTVNIQQKEDENGRIFYVGTYYL